MIFHNRGFNWRCGQPGRICDMELSEVQKLRLLNTEVQTPCLSDVLSFVAGSVPIIVEIKRCRALTKRCEDTAKCWAPIRAHMYRKL